MPRWASLPSTKYFTFMYDVDGGWNKDTVEQVARILHQTSDANYTTIYNWFKNTLKNNVPFEVVLAFDSTIKPGAVSGSAYNDTQRNITLNLGPEASKNSINISLSRMVLVAEFIEIFMRNQASGWDPFMSHGEALSQFAGFSLYPDVAPYYGAPNTWLHGGRPDWISTSDKSDTNPLSYGCGLLFIYFLNSQLGFSPNKIVQSIDKNQNLLAVYKNLTQQSNAFSAFEAIIDIRYPVGMQTSLNGSVNPFPIAQPVVNPPPVNPPSPPPVKIDCPGIQRDIAALQSDIKALSKEPRTPQNKADLQDMEQQLSDLRETYSEFCSGRVPS